MLSNSKVEEHLESRVQSWACDTIKLKIQKVKIFLKKYSSKEIETYAKSKLPELVLEKSSLWFLNPLIAVNVSSKRGNPPCIVISSCAKEYLHLVEEAGRTSGPLGSNLTQLLTEDYPKLSMWLLSPTSFSSLLWKTHDYVLCCQIKVISHNSQLWGHLTAQVDAPLSWTISQCLKQG